MLQEFSVDRVSFSDDGHARLFQALSNAPQHTQHLTRVTFRSESDDILGIQAVQAFALSLQQYRACPNLESLDITKWDLGGAEAQGMAALLGASLASPRLYENLKRLGLYNNALTPKAMQLLAQFMASGGFPDLKDLTICHDPAIGDAGLQYLVAGLQSYHSQSFRKLHFTGCGIGDEGVRFFAQACVEGFPNGLKLVRFYCDLTAEVQEECRELMKEHGVKASFSHEESQG
jgi:hypothetical protein